MVILRMLLSMSDHNSYKRTGQSMLPFVPCYSNKWLHDEARQDVVHLFNQDLPKWLEAAYTALNQYLQTQCSKCD